ncbi:hypothetical protein [Acanthopleuribacter pedis]|uniref:Uncharacterized protein n=1 Tax=Acanthopleuribacter pedis TaxID=442870 RepID=A0A8J7QD02_9BACT|nr:hypothetical protein [Acanthopleuribacter pedis]MBO1317315.1 hypothetical protein [Acanthopleuribacter pedis]MBO1318622.1 hypothetical protein [Acanthopleuribacter pedis]
MELDLVWIYRRVGVNERLAAEKAHLAGRLLTNWNCPHGFHPKHCKKTPLKKAPKQWARDQGWPTPLLGFEKQFLETLLSDDDHFRLGLDKGGVELFVPIKEWVVPDKDVATWERENKDPKNWDALAGNFRVLCQILNHGVPVVVAGRTYTSSGTFYRDFVMKGYRNLEEGADLFILAP